MEEIQELSLKYENNIHIFLLHISYYSYHVIFSDSAIARNKSREYQHWNKVNK